MSMIIAHQGQLSLPSLRGMLTRSTL